MNLQYVNRGGSKRLLEAKRSSSWAIANKCCCNGKILAPCGSNCTQLYRITLSNVDARTTCIPYSLGGSSAKVTGGSAVTGSKINGVWIVEYDPLVSSTGRGCAWTWTDATSVISDGWISSDDCTTGKGEFISFNIWLFWDGANHHSLYIWNSGSAGQYAHVFFESDDVMDDCSTTINPANLFTAHSYDFTFTDPLGFVAAPPVLGANGTALIEAI